MKKIQFILLLTLFSLKSFSLSLRNDSSKNENWIYNTNKNFLVLEDSSIIEFNTLSEGGKLIGKPMFILDEDRKIEKSKVIAYQYQSEYYVKFLNEFYKRILEGKISRYYLLRTEMGTQYQKAGFSESYVIQKENGEILNEKLVSLKNLVKDKPKIYSEVNKAYNKEKSYALYLILGVIVAVGGIIILTIPGIIFTILGLSLIGASLFNGIRLLILFNTKKEFNVKKIIEQYNKS